MDRLKLINALERRFREAPECHVTALDKHAIFSEALMRISSDTNLLAFALDLGIDIGEPALVRRPLSQAQAAYEDGELQ